MHNYLADFDLLSARRFRGGCVTRGVSGTPWMLRVDWVCLKDFGGSGRD
jgi:hypothetical protein